jgi:hypothetical protein
MTWNSQTPFRVRCTIDCKFDSSRDARLHRVHRLRGTETLYFKSLFTSILVQ